MSEQEPLFRVVHGTPTAEELAALVGVLVTRARPAESPTRPVEAPAWVRSNRPGVISATGLPGRPGADAWRLSALPR